uniref:Enamelin n=1 Tax=Panagrolaimus sp. JU765 TaxID=591449 RepID=A0AC34QQA5_9BILA
MKPIIFLCFFAIASAWPFERPYFEDYDNYPRGGYGRPQGYYGGGYGRPSYIRPDQFQIQTDYMRPTGGYGRPQNMYPTPNYGNNYPSQPNVDNSQPNFGNSQPNLGTAQPNAWDRPAPNPTTFGNRFASSNPDTQPGMTGQIAVEPATKVAEGVVNTGSQIDTTGVRTFGSSSATAADAAGSDQQPSNGQLTDMNDSNNSGMDGTPSPGFASGSSSAGLFGAAPAGSGTAEPSTLAPETPTINPAATADGALVLG